MGAARLSLAGLDWRRGEGRPVGIAVFAAGWCSCGELLEVCLRDLV